MNGGYCHYYMGDADASDGELLADHGVQFVPAASWDSETWGGLGVGSELTTANDALRMSPDCADEDTDCTAAFVGGAELSATWY